MLTFFPKEPKINFMSRMGMFATLSGVMVLGSVLLVATVGLNFGIDFAGGYEIQAKFETAVTDAQIKEVVAPLGLSDAQVQAFPDSDNEFLILVRKHGTMTDVKKAAVKLGLEDLAGGEEGLSNWSMAESGESFSVGFNTPVTEEQLRQLVSSNDLEIQTVEGGTRSDQPEYRVTLVSISAKIDAALHEAFNIPATTEVIKRVEFVGPQVGEQLRNQGIMAVLWALFFILLYIAVRFDLSFAPGAIVALVHDVCITIGVFAVFQIDFNLPIIAAVLAIVGYSLNDTIVVYDRVRENMHRLKGRGLRELVNVSINQTLSRTLLTSLTTLLVISALLVVGGGTIRDFSLALFVGVLVGTYSSVAIATPVFVLLHERLASNEGKKSAAASTAKAG